MTSGYLYILSNPYLEPNLLKIGFTTREPAERARALGRSTAIPGSFRVEFSMPVVDCKVAERRLHLLLDEWRIDKNKEFFRISVQNAKSLCASIGVFENEEMPAARALLLHPDFYVTQVVPRLKLHTLNALMHVLSATQHNSLVDHLLEERFLIVDGFTHATALAKLRNIRPRAASAALQRLGAMAPHLTYVLPSDGKPIHLFTKFVYGAGHAAWTFEPAFRRLFITPTA